MNVVCLCELTNQLVVNFHSFIGRLSHGTVAFFYLIKRGDKVIDFNEKLAEKEGRVTPKALLEDTLNNVNEIDRIVIVIKDKEGIVSVCYSDGMQLQALGMLEVGKTDIINDMYER